MSEQKPCCAHINIERRRESPNGGMTITREWWECRDCKIEFGPISRLTDRVRVLEKERDEVCPTCANGTVYEQLVSAQKQIADLTAKLAEVEGERDRQYEVNAGMIAKHAAAEAQRGIAINDSEPWKWLCGVASQNDDPARFLRRLSHEWITMRSRAGAAEAALRDCLNILKISLKGQTGAFPNAVCEAELPRYERVAALRP